MSSFFKRLSYSFGNEDWETEQSALKIKKGDRALCITASGDRPLHLLLDDCKEVISLDANPIQNYLLDLKMAAMRELDFSHYLSFMGVQAEKDRNMRFNQLTKNMNKSSVEYWKNNKKCIAKGILYQGTVERWIDRFAKVLKIFRGKKTQKLFSFSNLEDQKKYVQSKEWNTLAWRKLFEIALNPRLSQYFLNDPGLNAHIDPTIKPGKYIYDRMNNCLSNCLAKESILASLVLQGKVYNEGLPPYLTKKGFEVIKKRLDRITYYTTDLISYVENAAENSFDCFSLSDVASYIDEKTFIRLLRAVHRAAKPGARFCVRELMSRHQIPEDLKLIFKRDSVLEQELEKRDRCFVYRFMTGTIQKT